MISYEYYKTFYFCVKYMNFTKAAYALGTSQSSVSHTVKTLEYQLGCRLFTRNNRGISLTSEGEQLFSYVSKGCEYFIKGENKIIGGSSTESGSVYLSATETALNCFLFKALNKFRTLYPNIKFKIENLNSFNAAESVKTGISDFAVLPTPVKISKPLVEKPLVIFRDVLICGSRFTEISEKPFKIADIVKYPYISLCKGTATRAFYDMFFERENIFISPDIEVATADMVIPMVKNNMGIGYVPELMPEIFGGNINIITADISPAPRSINIVYNTSVPQSPAAKTFLNFCVSESHIT